jgi:hypothetical protein
MLRQWQMSLHILVGLVVVQKPFLGIALLMHLELGKPTQMKYRSINEKMSSSLAKDNKFLKLDYTRQ